MKGVWLAQACSCAVALALTSCYWLAKYEDLSSDYGDTAAVDGGDVADANQAAVDAGRSFCPEDAGALVYCMDFDGVDAGALDLVASGAGVAIVDGPAVSSPSSLFVGLEGAASFGRYDVPLSLQPTTTSLQFQMQMVNLNEGTTTLAITLSQASTQTVRTLNVVVAPTGQFQVQEYFALADGGTELNAHPWFQVDAGAPPAWHHVVLTLTADDATGRYASGLTVDDQILEDGEPLVLPWAQGAVTLHVGVTYAATGGAEFYFDDVRADFGM